MNAQANSSVRIETIEGAFEIDGETHKDITTLTRTGKLLETGDRLPAVPGIEIGKPFIFQTVNAFNTETCDICTAKLETFHIDNPTMPVYSLTKQSAQEIKKNDHITHARLTIDHETAIDLGVAVVAAPGGDEEFWAHALRRVVGAVDSNGIIIFIQHPDDQDELPDFTKLYKKALAAS